MGSIFLRKGIYYYDPKIEDGKPISLRTRDSDDAILRVAHYLKHGSIVPAEFEAEKKFYRSKEFTKALIESWVEHIHPKGKDSLVRPKTEAAYKLAFRHWEKVCGTRKPAPGDQDFFVAELITQGYSGSSINLFLKALHAIGQYGETKKLFERNPWTCEQVKVHKKPISFLTKVQLEILIEEAFKISKECGNFCVLTGYAGLRTSEALAARPSWYNPFNHAVHVQCDESFQTKSGENRIIPGRPEVQAVFDGVSVLPQKVNLDRVFTTGYHLYYLSDFNRALENARKRIPIEYCTPHTLRHTFASLLVQSGCSIFKVSVWLGHSDVRITANVYAHLAENDEDINRF